MLRTSLLAVCGFLLTVPALAQPTVVIETTAGGLTCKLFAKERPVTVERFLTLGGGFYEGASVNPNSAGISMAKASSEAPFPAETKPELKFDRPGLLAMSAGKGGANPNRLILTDHANAEMDGRGVVFGECDQVSIEQAAWLREKLQATDNHPATPTRVEHISIFREGEATFSTFPHTVTDFGKARSPSGPEPAGPTATLDTTAGRIVCRLFTRESPIATATFLALVAGSKDWTDPRTHEVQHGKRFYDGMAFDRVLPDYYIQFGDITGDISGKTDIGFRFQNETAPGLTFDRPGRLAFGNGGKDTNNSELFFALNPMHALDNGYTIIGQCDAASVAVLERIAHLPRDGSNLPLTPVVIKRIDIKP